MNRNTLFYSSLLLLLVGLPLLLGGCDRKKDSSKKQSFLQIGEFTIHKKSGNLTVVRDGAGRNLALVPRGAPAPLDFPPERIIRVPVKRVAAYSSFDVATLRILGVLRESLVGVTTPLRRWYVDDVRDGLISGKIAYLGNAGSIDFERLKLQKPELVLTWDPSIIPMLDDLGIACVITSTPVAMCLNARMSFVKFLAPFFDREKEADDYFNRVRSSLAEIKAKTAKQWPKPKVMWGDMYEKRVLVEPGNAWIGELVGLVNSGYLFDDVYGTSCIEISMERFLYSGMEADIYFTYRTPESGATSKAALAKLHPLMADIKPLGSEGRVYAPLPHYSQSGDRLDEIFTEIAAIIHPDSYPGYQLRYFRELPATDPAIKEER